MHLIKTVKTNKTKVWTEYKTTYTTRSHLRLDSDLNKKCKIFIFSHLTHTNQYLVPYYKRHFYLPAENLDEFGQVK